MATFDELLKKQKFRLEKMSTNEPVVTPIERKKIVRTGPSRPWQEHLPQYQTVNFQTGKLEPATVQSQINGEKPDTNRTQTGHKTGVFFINWFAKKSDSFYL